MKKLCLFAVLASLIVATGCENNQDDHSRDNQGRRSNCCSCGVNRN